jgi:hypothetical protein
MCLKTTELVSLIATTNFRAMLVEVLAYKYFNYNKNKKILPLNE